MNADITKQLDPEQISQLRERAKGSLFFFAKWVLGYSKLSVRVHGPICKLLEDREQTRLRFVLPRGWFKTTIMSIAYPMWRAINDPEVRILVIQNTLTNATQKLSSIKRHFEDNEIFRCLFPELLPKKGAKWTSEALCVPRKGAWPESTFEAAGARTGVTSRHYDEIIEDDTVAPDQDELGMDNVVPTKDDIDKAIGLHRLMTPLLTPTPLARNIVVGTRWFEVDLLSWIKEHEPYFLSYERAARETDGVPDPQGEPAFPEVYGEAKLKQIAQSMGPYLFSCLYMNQPTRSADMTFRQEWFKYYDVRPEDLVTYTTVDPAGDPEDTKGKPDYNVVLTAGKSLTSGEIFVLGYDNLQCSPSELIDAIFRHVRLYKPVKVGIESVAYQRTLLHWIREKKKGLNLYFWVEAIVNNRKSKNARIQGLQPLVHAGLLKFRPNMQDLVSQLLAFPHGGNDDIADALAMQLEMWHQTRSIREETEIIAEPDPRVLEHVILEHKRSKERHVENPVLDVYQPEDISAPWLVFN